MVVPTWVSPSVFLVIDEDLHGGYRVRHGKAVCDLKGTHHDSEVTSSVPLRAPEQRTRRRQAVSLPELWRRNVDAGNSGAETSDSRGDWSRLILGVYQEGINGR